MSFEFSKDRVTEIRRLLVESGTATMKDLVNNALTILEWTIEETKAGNEIAAVNQEQQVYRVLAMPILNRAASIGRKAA